MCRKERFDKRTAKTVLNQCRKEHRPECRIYECDKCVGWWHLTSEMEYNEKIYLTEEDLIFRDKWEQLKKG